MPDDELFALAERGAERQGRAVATVSRACSPIPVPQRFSEAFPRSQWLRLRKVGMFPPDKKLYPDYDKHLRDEHDRRDDVVLPRGAEQAV